MTPSRRCLILASVALVVASTILIKMGRTRFLWVTLLPTAWLAAGRR